MGRRQSRPRTYQHHVASSGRSRLSRLRVAVPRPAAYCHPRSPVRRFSGEQSATQQAGHFPLSQAAKIDFKSKPIVRLIDRVNTRWLRMSSKVSAGALLYARQHDANRIFCGHTHQAIHVEQDRIHYYNAGGWVDSRLTYLTVDEQGVQIHEYHERPDDRDSVQERGEADSSIADFVDESGLLEDVEYESV